MADENTINQTTAESTGSSETATAKLTLPVPAPGQTESVSMEAEQIVQVPFDVTNQTIVLDGGDLRIEFENGATLVLEDFATLADQGQAPLLLMVDGSVLPGDVLLTALTETPEETAADAAGSGGGTNRYVDDMGDTLGGIDRLGVQDPDPFGGETPQDLLDDQPILQDAEATQDVSITIDDTEITISEEGEGTDTFTISLSEEIVAGNIVTVDVAFGGDADDADFYQAAQEALQDAAAATAGVDFDGTTLTYTDAFVGTDLDFSVQARNDDELDSPETLTVTLSNADSLNGSATAIDTEDVTITDTDQDNQSIQITIADTQDVISEEGEGTDSFTISLSEAINTGNTITVDVDFATGTDTEDADFYTAAQDALQTTADETTGVSFDGTTLTYTDDFVGTDLDFSVQAKNDDLTDSPETLNITLGNATAVNGTVTAADSEDVTITDVDQNISIAISDTQESINEAGQETDTFTISLSEEINPGNIVTVKVGYTLNTDTADADFTTAPPEATTQSTSTPEGVSFDKDTGILTFTDEFVGTELSFTLQARADDEVESPETLTITLSDPTAVNGTATITQATEDVTVLDQDQDQAITITIADTQDSISEEGEETDSFTISLSEAINAGNTVTVDVDFSGDADDADFYQAAQEALQDIAAATAGVDFDGTTLTYTDAFVGTNLTFDVQAKDDDLTDSPETLTVTLSNATAVNGTAIATDAEDVIITDTDQDDQSIQITIADTQDVISEEGEGTDTFTISLSEAINAGNTLTVDVDFATGTDTEDADFYTAAQDALQAAAEGTAGVSFDGSTLTYTDAFVGTDLTFDVQAKDDDLTDSPETLNITLGNATAVIGTASAADIEDVTITDTDHEDQSIQVTITDTQNFISEEAEETDTFTISLSEAIDTGNTVTVDVAFSGNADDADFYQTAQDALQTAADGTTGVSFDGSTLTYTDAFVGTDLDFSVQAKDDDELDSPETLTVTLSNATAVTGTASAADAENVIITAMPRFTSPSTRPPALVKMRPKRPRLPSP
ncbi:MAG: hypothetical protein JRC99_02765 [Deltaproteobacteria bacterium]|nr:hypothetical protein [Deltaproteobacteria bacterium]